MSQAVVIFGPPASGKTLNAEKLRVHFGMDKIVDGWMERHDPEPMVPGTLYLTNVAHHDARALAQLLPPARDFGVQVVHINTALEAIEKEAPSTGSTRGNFDDLTDEEKENVELRDSVEFGAPRVRLKWFTPDGDELVAHMARVSNSKAQLGDPGDKLIGYLIRNHHWSPFEMVNLCLEIHTERDISAQILRHSKEFRFQEFSTRYAEVEDLRWNIECRFQDPKNRQASLTLEDREKQYDIETSAGMSAANYDSDTVAYWDAVVNETRTRSLEGYRAALERGVAKETARRILPFGLCPTVMYINSNLRGWIHYLAERTKPGVQKEHREIALAVEPVFAECFPQVWAAVLAYRQMQERKEQAATNWFKLEELIKTRDTVLVAPFGEGVGWAQNNGDYLWKPF